MGMRPELEEMERWGAVSIFKESARQLQKHYRLLLAFVLIYYLPISFFFVSVTSSFSPSSTPLLDTSVVKGPVNTAQTTDPFDDAFSHSYPHIYRWTIIVLCLVLRAFSERAKFDAESAVTACQNTRSPTSTDDDRSMVPKVVEFPPHLLLLKSITHCYVALAFLFLSFIIGGILQAIIFVTVGWSDPKSFFIYGFFFPVLATIRSLTILVALVLVIVLLVYWRKTTAEWSKETPEEKC